MPRPGYDTTGMGKFQVNVAPPQADIVVLTERSQAQALGRVGQGVWVA